jgi:hypothetical protein
MHYLKSGGRVALKESPEKLISRMLSFPKFLFNVQNNTAFQQLFASPAYRAAIDVVCPNSILDPFQLSMILQARRWFFTWRRLRSRVLL